MTLLSLFVLAAVVSTWPAPRAAFAQPGNSGGPRVTVVNPVPLPVTFPGTPFQIVLCSSAAFNGADLPDCSGNETSLKLPADRRAVIELATARCRYRAVDFLHLSLSTQVGGVRAEYPLHMESSDLGTGSVEGALQGRIYADPGTAFGLNSGSSAPGTAGPGSVECELAISGLLIAQ